MHRPYKYVDTVGESEQTEISMTESQMFTFGHPLHHILDTNAGKQLS